MSRLGLLGAACLLVITFGCNDDPTEPIATLTITTTSLPNPLPHR